MKDDRGKSIAWRSVSCKMTCYHVTDKNTVWILSLHFVPKPHFLPGFTETISATMVDVWTVCWRAPEDKHNDRAMITLYQLKTNANARLSNMVASDALLRGHSVCWNEPATGPLGMNISASRLKLHFKEFETDRQTDRLNLSDGCVSTKLRVTGNHSCFILFILNCISLYTHVYWALSNSICYNFPQLTWQLCFHVLMRL